MIKISFDLVLSTTEPSIVRNTREKEDLSPEIIKCVIFLDVNLQYMPYTSIG